MDNQFSTIVNDKETIKAYLDGLVDNNLLDYDGPGVYLRFERRSIFRVTLGTDGLSCFEQERMRPSEWYMEELPYNEKTLSKLRSRLGS
jgi:hypothetical protein